MSLLRKKCTNMKTLKIDMQGHTITTADPGAKQLSRLRNVNILFGRTLSTRSHTWRAESKKSARRKIPFKPDKLSDRVVEQALRNGWSAFSRYYAHMESWKGLRKIKGRTEQTTRQSLDSVIDHRWLGRITMEEIILLAEYEIPHGVEYRMATFSSFAMLRITCPLYP